MAVLFGLFLFVGFATLGGNQFWDRVMLWITDKSSIDSAYVRGASSVTVSSRSYRY